MATISPANSTITDTVSLILLDTSKGSNITPGVTNNFITYISSSTVPGRIATIRDATGYVSTGNFILLSTTKNVYFADGSSTLSITQPFGFVSFSSRSTNQWSVLNTFAFPDPLGTSYVSNVNVMNSVNTSNISVNNISSGSITINSIRGSSISTNSISTSSIWTNSISTINISTNGIRANFIDTNSISTTNLSTNGIRANFIDINSISTINVSTNSIWANSISTTNCSSSNVYTNSIYSLNNNLIGINEDINLNNKNIFDCYSFYLQDTFNGNYPTQFFITEVLANGKTQLGYLSSNSPMEEKRNVAQDWSYYEAETNLNMVNYSISNTNIVYTTTIQTSNISSINISSSNISTANLFTPFIQASTISTSRLFTSLIQASTISTTSLFTTLVSTSFLQASTISTLSLNTRSISSLFTQTSSILTGLLQLRGVTSNGLLTTNTNASQLLFNGAQVGSWIGTASTDLNMNSFNINNVTNLNGTPVASIGAALWSQYIATQDVNINGYSLYNIASLFAQTITAQTITAQQTTNLSNLATNNTIPKLYVDNYNGSNVNINGADQSYVQILVNNSNKSIIKEFNSISNLYYYKTNLIFTGRDGGGANPLTYGNLYYTFSNVISGNQVEGLNYNSVKPYVYSINSVAELNVNFTDVYNLSNFIGSGCNTSTDYVINLYMNNLSVTGCNISVLSNYKVSVIFEAILSN